MSGLKARSCCSDGSSLTSTRGSPAGATGKSSSIHSPSGSAPSTPLRVWKRMALVFGTGPACHRTWALARVAWPQRSTSTVGVNQRRSQSPSGRAVMNAVSDRFISRATACIQASSGTASRTHTAAGLPAKGRSVKASTVTIVVKSIGARHHGDEGVLVGGETHRPDPPATAAHAPVLQLTGESRRLLAGAVLVSDDEDDHLYGRKLGGDAQPGIVTVGHDQSADHARRHAPRGLPGVLALARLGEEPGLEDSGE